MTVPRETRLAAFLSILERWGHALNLVSASQRSRVEAHVQDSLSIVPHLPSGADRLIDLGSGQGFPAIPIAIMTGMTVELIESDRRKAAFLTTVLAQLQLPGTVWATRIEDTKIPPASCVTARALAPLTELVTMARPFLTAGGCCLFLKGAAAATELEAVRRSQIVDAEIIPGPRPPSCLVKFTSLG